MSEIEIQRDILNQVIKKTISRIKELQEGLKSEKEDRKIYGGYEDCGSYYEEQVIKTEAVISELIAHKISLEKWRTKLKFSLDIID